jgi:hypothetical protein
MLNWLKAVQLAAPNIDFEFLLFSHECRSTFNASSDVVELLQFQPNIHFVLFDDKRFEPIRRQFCNSTKVSDSTSQEAIRRCAAFDNMCVKPLKNAYFDEIFTKMLHLIAPDKSECASY